MSCQLARRTIRINGGDDEEYDVVTCDDDVLYFDRRVLTALGARVYRYPNRIEIDTLPRLSVSTEGGRLKLIRTPGSPKFDRGSRRPRVTQTTEEGTLALRARVEDGKLVGLDGSLYYREKNVTADIAFRLADGGIEPSGEVTVDLGDLDITISGNPDNYTGAIEFEKGDCKLSLEVIAGKDRPVSWALAFSIAF